MIKKKYMWALVLLFIVGIIAVPLRAWAVDSEGSPEGQLSPTPTQNDPPKPPPSKTNINKPRPVARKAAPRKPVATHIVRFNQDYSRVQKLAREIEASINKVNKTKVAKNDMNRMASLRKLLADLNKDLKGVMQELASVNSLMRNAESLDKQKRADPSRGNQLASQLEQKIAVLEKKKMALATKSKNLGDKLDAMADMNQLNMLELQQAQNRMTQMMSMLTNMAQRAHQTMTSIIDNMR